MIFDPCTQFPPTESYRAIPGTGGPEPAPEATLLPPAPRSHAAEPQPTPEPTAGRFGIKTDQPDDTEAEWYLEQTLEHDDLAPDQMPSRRCRNQRSPTADAPVKSCVFTVDGLRLPEEILEPHHPALFTTEVTWSQVSAPGCNGYGAWQQQRLQLNNRYAIDLSNGGVAVRLWIFRSKR